MNRTIAFAQSFQPELPYQEAVDLGRTAEWWRIAFQKAFAMQELMTTGSFTRFREIVETGLIGIGHYDEKANLSDADLATLKAVAERLRELEHKFNFQRGLVEAAHKAFHELVGPDEPVRFQHDSDEEFDPAAQLRRIAAARDEARAELAAGQQKKVEGGFC